MKQKTFSDQELFDVSDVSFDLKQNTRKGLLCLVAKSEEPWNLMRYYCALKSYLTKLESEMGIMGEPPEEQ